MPSPMDQMPCPAERQWDLLATGLIRDDEAFAMLNHAAGCDRCAEYLRASIDIFQAGDISQPGDRAVVEPVVIPPRRARWIPLSIAAMIVAVMGALTLLYFRAQSDPLAQLAAAYTKERPFELRIAGSAYGPLRVERGSAATLTAQPEELLRTEIKIRSELQRNPRDPVWLHAKGRLALLEWRPEEAMEALRDSESAGGGSPALWIDLATAHYELAQRSGDLSSLQTAALQTALGLLGRAFQSEPKNPAILFNRALVLERLHQTQAAIDSVEQLLTIEPNGPWSEESRRVLARLRAQQH